MDILSALNKFLAYILLIVPESNGIVNNTFRGGVPVSQDGPLQDVISITAGQFFSVSLSIFKTLVELTVYVAPDDLTITDVAKPLFD